MRITALLIAALLVIPGTLRAQQQADSVIATHRIVATCTSLGIATMNNLDTYLSGYDHKGKALTLSHERVRNTRCGASSPKRRTFFGATAGTASLHGNTELTAMVNYNIGWYYPLLTTGALQLLGGAQAELGGGAIYLPSNSNNPVSAKARVTAAASAMALYRIATKKGTCTLRAQVDAPLTGVMFAPEFGQSYYEIFTLGDNDNTVAVTHPLNAPSLRTTLSADVPFTLWGRSATMRIGYTADIFQSELNDIRTHLYHHSFSIGFVKTIYKIKNGDKLKEYSPF